MEDIQLIIYIIFAVLYLIFKAMQKGKEASQQKAQDRQQERKRQAPKSFEELLREFSGEPYADTRTEEEIEDEQLETERRQRREATIDKPATQQKVARESQPTEYFSYETEYDDQAKQVYQESIQSGKKAQTLDEMIDLEKLEVGKVQLVEEKEDGKTFSNEILKAFKDEQSIKKAFIFSEILNRKYT